MDLIRMGFTMFRLEQARVYSSSAEAARKRTLDLVIAESRSSNVDAVDFTSESYLKQLIELASRGKKKVAAGTGLQFFYIKGGGEGFLPAGYRGRDASRVTFGGGATTSGATGTVMVFDNNDLLAVFDGAGKLVDAALLERPLSITHPNIWSEATANRILDAWDGQRVSLYRNANFDIRYYGLMISDKLGWYSSGKVRVDIHKQEATNGCIFIVDPSTPRLSDAAKLNAFEPRLIERVQKLVGAKAKSNIGKMHVVSV